MTARDEEIQRARMRLRVAQRELNESLQNLLFLLGDGMTFEYPALEEWVKALSLRSARTILDVLDPGSTVIDLAMLEDYKLLRNVNFSSKSLKEIKNALSEIHLILGMTRKEAQIAYLSQLRPE